MYLFKMPGGTNIKLDHWKNLLTTCRGPYCPNKYTVIEGFLSCSIAMAGFLGNVGSAVILSGKGISRTSQNLMFNIIV